MYWSPYDYENITNKKPYFWIAEAMVDVRREKRSKKKREKILDFRSMAITLAAVGIFLLFQNLYKEEKKFELSNLRNVYEDFKETETRAAIAAIMLKFDIGNFVLEEKYNSDNMETNALFANNFLLALDTKNAQKATIGLKQYGDYIYGDVSRFGAINKRLAEQTININKAAKRINNKDSLAITDSVMLIYSMFENHYYKIQEILNLQRKILEIIEKDEADKRVSELSTAEEQIKEYYIDLEWQTERIADAHNKINKSFSNLEIE